MFLIKLFFEELLEILTHNIFGVLVEILLVVTLQVS